MMKFRKGSKVEVRESTSGEWRCAQIISGNGHTYSVQYDCSSITNKTIVERVPRKAIRPCPPIVKSVQLWQANDVVEVYCLDCWKAAVVMKASGGDHYLVRLIGSCEELNVHKSNIRVRQCWHGDQWLVLGKGSGNSEAWKSNRNSSLNCKKMSSEVWQADTGTKKRSANDHLPARDDSDCYEDPPVSSRIWNRVFPTESSPWKMRAIGKDGEHQRFVSMTSHPLLEKVDAVAYPRENMGEIYVHASFNNPPTGYYEIERFTSSGSIDNVLERCSETHDSNSDASSVGSCSMVSCGPNKFSSHMLAGPCQDVDTCSSDAESLIGGDDEEDKCTLSPKDVAAQVHSLELHAYRSTLQAMYASGSLSWEREAVLTNLRISLRISNDEHLMELRNLFLSGKKFPA